MDDKSGSLFPVKLQPGTLKGNDERLSSELIQRALNVPTLQLSDVGSWHAHVPFAYALIAAHAPRLTVELGVHKGDSYLTFCQALIDHGINGRAIGIDTWQGDPHAGEYDGDFVLADLRRRHDPHFTGISTLVRKTFDDALEEVEDGSIDLLHIDGLHTYEAVRHDFESWRPKLSERGVVLFHDTIVRSGDFAVWKLWAEIAPTAPSYEFDYGNGLGVLAVGTRVPEETLALLDVLRRKPAVMGSSAREILERISNGLADRENVKKLTDDIARIENDWADERVRAMAEINRLAEAHREDVAESARLRQELDCANRKLPARIGRGATAVYAAVLQPDARKLLAGKVKHKTRLAGRWAISALPVQEQSKVRIKGSLLRTYRKLRGLDPDAGAANYLVHGNQMLRIADERYRDLAASARGRPTNVPPRTVTIVIPVYNQLSFTLNCLAALNKHTTEIEHEIIVVDDGSSDETQATLSQLDGITYIRNPENLGFIGSCNAGAQRASKEYVCFLNNDTEVLPYWLSALVNTFEVQENVGLVGSKLIYPDGKLQEAGGLIWNDGSGWNWGRLKNPRDPHFCYARKADYCSGAAIVLPRVLFQSLGGFDPHFTPAYFEDCDLAFKVRSLGLATIYQPLSQVIHHEGVTSGVDLNSGAKKFQVVNTHKFAARWANVLPHQGQSGVDSDFVCDRGTIGRILVLDQVTPEPDRDAGSIAMLEIMRALRDLGYKITFAPCANFCWVAPYTETLAALGIESLVHPSTKSVEDHLSIFGSRYDAVIISRPITGQTYRQALRKYAPQARTIYYACDLHFLREERLYMLNQPKVVLGRSDSHRLARVRELDLMSSVDVCIVHSLAEQALLKGLRPSLKVIRFPLIYEPRGEGLPFEKRQNVIFVGGYAHPPNVDGALHFIHDVFPLLADRLPADSRFIAAGSNPPPSLMSLAGPRIDVTGFIDDIGSILYSSRVMVVPLRYGAGIKGKIVAGMAHGLPIVTTTIGAEGMGLVHEEHVLIADDPAEFAEAVERIYNDKQLWLKLRDAGLDWVARTTSRSSGLKIIENLLETAGMPFARNASLAATATELGASSAFGSPAVLQDVPSIVAAAEHVAGPGINKNALVIVPDDVAFQSMAVSLKRPIQSLSTFAARPTSANTVVVIADSSNEAGMRQLSTALHNNVASEATVVVAFVPPRLTATRAGYALSAPFSDREFERIMRLPIQEQWAADFTFEKRACRWYTDTTLNIFPSISVLHIGPIAPER